MGKTTKFESGETLRREVEAVLINSNDAAKNVGRWKNSTTNQTVDDSNSPYSNNFRLEY